MNKLVYKKRGSGNLRVEGIDKKKVQQKQHQYSKNTAKSGMKWSVVANVHLVGHALCQLNVIAEFLGQSFCCFVLSLLLALQPAL